MKKIVATMLLLGFISLNTPVFAAETHGTNGEVSGRSVGAALCSLIIWPGIGQAINGQTTEKNVTHAILGLTGIFRFWSCYDALVDRTGGVWHNRI